MARKHTERNQLLAVIILLIILIGIQIAIHNPKHSINNKNETEKHP